jgi:hypothetical protein
MSKKTKKIKTWIDEGFGFPVVLLNPPMIEVRGVQTPDINYKIYAKCVLHALACKPARLTGAEVKFIRQHFQKTLTQFSDRFGQKSYQAVMKWEAFNKKATNMNWTTEKDIRLFIINQLKAKPKAFKELYEDLEEPKQPSQEPVTLSAELLAA